MSDYVHIVSLIAPSPPDFGGAFDLYYKIPALANAGKKIILHYFDYKEGRGHEGLETYCEEINKYSRTVFLKSLLTLKPHIVSSRTEPELIHRLNRDEYPVLLEGIHCTGIISSLRKRKMIVRVHNDEEAYYKNLLKTENNLLKSAYFFYESLLLSRYQKQLSGDSTYAFVSETDLKVFKEKYHHSKQIFLPCFLPWQNINSSAGKGEYCLYHGNLSVPENVHAAVWLAETVFSQINFPLIIAGKNTDAVKNQFSDNSNLRLINNPSDDELSELIKHAHINVLPSFNTTGVKLKLLHALFEGRFCISNYNGVAGSGVEDYVIHAETMEDWINAVQQKQSIEFDDEMIAARKNILPVYNNKLNAEKLSALL